MDINTIVTIIATLLLSLGGIFFTLFNKRINKLEDGKVDKDVCKIIKKGDEEDFNELKTTTKETHDAVIKIKTHLGIE